MKRLLALLLAMLLPVCAAAEARGFSVSIGMNPDLFALYGKQILLQDPELTDDNISTIIEATIRIINGLGIDFAVQDDAMTLKVRLGSGELVDLALHQEERNMILTSSMLAGYALQMDASDVDAIDYTPSTEVLISIENALSTWLSGIEPTVSTGIFSGDAYENGTHCKTWCLTDQDIAALASAMMSEEVRAWLSMILAKMDLDFIDLFNRFDELNDQVAKDDAFLYMLRYVTDDADQFVGASLTVMNGQSQVATLSLGATQKSVKIVVGLGLSHQNYWWAFSGKQSQLRNITYLSGNSHEWIADKAQSFSYVSAANAPMTSYMLRATLTKSGNRYLWDGSLSQGDESVYEYLCSSSGTYIPSTGSLDCRISLGDAPYEPLWLDITCGPVDAILPLDSALQRCDTENAEQFQALVDRFLASIAARAIKLLPMDLIMMLNQVTIP